jgi:hypothetical protein
MLTALHNRGLVSQQNGKVYYVGGGDRPRAPVTLGAGAAMKLSAAPGATSSGTNQIVIPGAGLSLDSISASPHMLKMASSMLLGGPAAAPAPSNGGPPPARPQLPPAPPPAAAPSSPFKLDGAKQTFYYRDPALPANWYIRIDRTQVTLLFRMRH